MTSVAPSQAPSSSPFADAAASESRLSSSAGPSSGPSASLEGLRMKLASLKAQRASLKRELESVKSAPIPTSSLGKKDSPEEQDLAEQLAQAEESLVLCRTLGWTCFLVDLSPGRRAKSLTGGGHVGIGARMEAFVNGRFHSPHYLLFGRAPPPVEARITSSTIESTSRSSDAQLSSAEGPFRLLRHTLPSCIPLAQLVDEFLPTSSAPPQDDDEMMRGWNLVASLNAIGGGIDTFLSAVHAYLQAFVSRRQAFASVSAQQDLDGDYYPPEGYASASYTSLRLEAVIDEKDADALAVESALGVAGEPGSTMRSRPTAPSRHVRVDIRLTPLSDRLETQQDHPPKHAGDAAEPTLRDASHGVGGSVSVFIVDPTASRSLRTQRRADLEALFFKREDGEEANAGSRDAPGFDQAFHQVLRTIRAEIN
ncbi:hypothetical protein CBOM_07142 [Ceraceosorus bombacis]|uniref:Uncharacterized protein n=1 Tax=Ceraceosorus bombacis TaxID=401625 RepID=A0A0P1B779_9BASI|nr:hypothetical protein CBOM_07142 [Ceraceosorus bombacis]